MKNINENDIIFDFDCKHTLVFSYYGGEGNDQCAFYNYIVGYKASVDATYEAFVRAIHSNNNEVADTICYPLVYLYRHITELLLKYSYIELRKNRTEKEIKSFLQKGHRLIDLWKLVKPDFERLSKRTGVETNILAIEHYMTELSKIDDTSMAYRYPIKKNLNSFHDKESRLNIPQLKERMDVFYNYMIDIIDSLSKHLEDVVYNFEFDNCFTNALNKSLPKIGVALNRIKVNIVKYAQDYDIEQALREMDELLRGNTDKYEWTNTFSEQEKSVLLLLYYTGLQIPHNTLAKDKIERRKDVMKLMFSNTLVCRWLQLDAPKSDTKDELFMKYITNGGRMSKKYIELTLFELGIPYQES